MFTWSNVHNVETFKSSQHSLRNLELVLPRILFEWKNSEELKRYIEFTQFYWNAIWSSLNVFYRVFLTSHNSLFVVATFDPYRSMAFRQLFKNQHLTHQSLGEKSKNQGLVKGAILCFRNPYSYFWHGESTSTAS